MIRYAIMIIMTAISYSTYAQSSVKEINSIKRDSKYIWAEATEETKAKAEDAAKVALTLVAKDYFSTLDLEILKSKVEGCSHIHMERGNMHRVFVFMPKEATFSSSDDLAIESSTAKVTDSSLKTWQQYLIGSLMKCANVEEVVNHMDRMKAQNKVTQTGTKSTQPRNPQKAFYIFFDNALNTIAILGKEDNGERMNYMTNKKESIKDYSRFVHIWFVIPN